MSTDTLLAIVEPLLTWYRQNARILPWREEPTPYRVWISEIMLQQTRVEAVKPYFARFLEALPTVPALAQAPEQQLMKLWEGLGYYSRARNLQRAARVMVEQFDGTLPPDYESLLKLPGIGPYTAGAIASIAYGIPVPAVDGNVLRVVMRLIAGWDDIADPNVKRDVAQRMARVLPKDCPGDFNQAMMELGATVCVPGGEPKCRECPLESLCITKKKGLWKEIPVKSVPKPKRMEEKTVFLVEWKEKVAIHKRPPKGLLASLYELPNIEGHLTKEEAAEQVKSWIWEDDGKREEKPTGITVEPLGTAKHIFSHVQWDMVGYRVKIAWENEKEPGKLLENTHFFMVDRAALKEEYSVPSAFGAYVRLLG